MIDEIMSRAKVVFLSDKVHEDHIAFHKHVGKIKNKKFNEKEFEELRIDNADIPFDLCYFEFINHDYGTNYERVHPNGYLEKEPSEISSGNVIGAFVGDLAGDGQNSITYLSVLQRRTRPLILSSAKYLSPIDQNLIKTINKKEYSTAHCSYRKSVKLGGGFKSCFINDIIYCDRTAELRDNPLSIDRKPFVYSHTFDVRGHWRSVGKDTLGKNRAGERLLLGRTWVNSFKKGQGDYVKKTRLFI
jgi:hypothetical protein